MEFIKKYELTGTEKAIYLLGDTHYPRGKRNKFLEVIEKIKQDKNSYAILMGDYVESITHLDKRYDAEETAKMILERELPVNLIQCQFELFEEDISKIKEKILGLHLGNHEDTFRKQTGFNELSSMCKRLKVDYLNTIAVFDFKFNGNHFFMQTSHGVGGGVTEGFAYNQLNKHNQIFADLDIIAEGHTHKLGVNIAIPPLKISNGDIRQKIQYQCACGSFLANYELGISSYAEKKHYKPLPIGYIKIIFRDNNIDSVTPIPV